MAKAYSDTKVSVARSREGIESVLRKWEALGVQWEDNFEEQRATLRFRWPHEGAELVARLHLVFEEPERWVGNRTRSDAMMTKARDAERRRVHRVTFHWLKTQFEAVDAGLFEAVDVMLPWIEDARGVTVGEAMRPALCLMSTTDVRKALGPGETS